MLIRQHQMPGTRPHGILSLGADTLQPLTKIIQTRTGREGTVDKGHLPAELRHHHIEFGIGNERAFQHQDFRLAGMFVQHVLEVAEARLQAHHPAFAQGIDGRVRHLAEVLAEEMTQRAVDGRQHGGGRIITHAGDHFLAVLGHRGQHLLQLFHRVACGNLAAAQLGPGEQRGFRHVAQQRVQVHDLFDPVAKGLGCGQLILQFHVVVQFALGHIDRNHLPRPKRTLFPDGRFIHRHHARLGPGNQQPVARHDIAHRAQTVAVKPAAHPAAIGHRQRRRAVPRLHHRVAIGIHVGPGLWHLAGHLRPGFGHQHGLGHRRVAARPHHHLEHRIQRAGIGRA